MEVACESSQVDHDFHGSLISMFALMIWLQLSIGLVVIAMAGAPLQIILILFILFTLLIPTFALQVYGIIYFIATRQKRKMLDRMRRLFSLFSHIETMVLHNAEIDPFSNFDEAYVLCASLKVLKGVKIYRLEVRSDYVRILLRLVYIEKIEINIVDTVGEIIS